jgi:hypothetical protein
MQVKNLSHICGLFLLRHFGAFLTQIVKAGRLELPEVSISPTKSMTELVVKQMFLIHGLLSPYKMTLRFHLTPVRMAISRKKQYQMLGRMCGLS